MRHDRIRLAVTYVLLSCFDTITIIVIIIIIIIIIIYY